MQKTIRIGIDAMGGDFAPENEIMGAVIALELFAKSKISKDFDLKIHIFGLKSKILEIAKSKNISLEKFTIVDATEIVTMEDDPTEVIKSKKNSSLYLGLQSAKNQEIDGFVSGGNTGAMLSLSTVLLGRISGVSRPAIAAFLPSAGEFPTLLIDAGATIDSKSRFLFDFAMLGSLYFKEVFSVENPTVGLLNVGEEESKGTDVLKETCQILKKSPLNFVGNVEGRDILRGNTNVVVCDGFVGNVLLKFAESFTSLLKSKIKNYADKSILNKIKAALSVPALKGVTKAFDYQEYGGVPILGVKGISIVGHGKSTPLAYANMIMRATELVHISFLQKIESFITNLSINIQ